MEFFNCDYRCSICGKTDVKLWRLHLYTEPLICATCAEKRQIPVSRTSKNWLINDSGKIFLRFGPSSENSNLMTYKLLIDLKDYFNEKESVVVDLIPAIPDNDGDFFGYSSSTTQVPAWWENLPTH